MTEVTFRSDLRVELVDSLGGDESVVRSARVSTGKDQESDEARNAGLINMLMRDRHGVPFESVVFTFRVELPIFVMRELVKHRISSINEISGRYVQLPAEFYLADPARPLVQSGKVGSYTFSHGSEIQWTAVRAVQEDSARDAYGAYEALLGIGVAKEVARQHLPLHIYTQCMMTLNGRSLMNLLNLRSPGTTAMWEIQQIAAQMDSHFADVAPLTREAFVKHGRVAP